MIEKNTLFILGAGASAPYNYPTGAELKSNIMNNIDFEILDTESKDGKDIKKIKATKNYLIRGIYRKNSADFINMKNDLLEARRSSVDAFLENRTEYTDIGKLAIACEIIERENPIKDSWDWFEHLHDAEFARCNSAEDYCKNNINFITFNYDRLLEHMLISSLKSTYGENEDTCAELIKESFNIIHVHGKLDDLPWEDENGRAYGDKPTSEEEWEKSAKGIKIIHEKIEEKFFKKARELVENAELIIFLGLNLHNTTNLDRLRIKDNLDGKRIYATFKGLTEPQRDDVREYFDDNIINGTVNIERRHPNVMNYTALKLLKEKVRFRN